MVKFAEPTYTKNIDGLTTDIRFELDNKPLQARMSNSHALKLRTLVATAEPLGEDAKHAALLNFLYRYNIVVMDDEEGGAANGPH